VIPLPSILSLAEMLDPCKRPSLRTFRQAARKKGWTAEYLQAACADPHTDLNTVLNTGPADTLLEDEGLLRLYRSK